MFKQYVKIPELRMEHSTEDTLVSRVPVKSNQERIYDCLLTGSLVQGSNVGYDYAHDAELPDYIVAHDVRGMDITDKMKMLQYVNRRVQETINNAHKDDKKPSDANNGSSVATEKETGTETPEPEKKPVEGAE